MKETKYISKEYTDCLRGIFSVLVVIHHLYQYSGLFRETYIGIILQLLGFISVAMFFFFSGYGLMFSANKNNYINHFFSKRFLPLYCFYVFLIILYSIWTLLEKSISPLRIIQSFFWGGTIVTNGWYLQATFFMYLLYLLVFKIFKSSNIQIITFSVGIFAYCVLCWSLNLGINWYQTIPCVVLGMIFYSQKKCIDALLKKYSWPIFIIFSILFAICFVLSAVSSIKVLYDVLYSMLFICAMISFSYILCGTPLIENKFTKLCGEYSLEIYVTHGLFLRLIKLEYLKNVYVYIFVVIIGTIVGSIIMKKVYTKIVLFFKEKDSSKQYCS